MIINPSATCDTAGTSYSLGERLAMNIYISETVPALVINVGMHIINAL